MTDTPCFTVRIRYPQNPSTNGLRWMIRSLTGRLGEAVEAEKRGDGPEWQDCLEDVVSNLESALAMAKALTGDRWA